MIFRAVPAFIRVEPVTTSGPVIASIPTEATLEIKASGEFEIAPVKHPTSFA